jgi:hypothetical protein
MELLLKRDVTVYGDLYFNLAEAYFAVGETNKALVLYQALSQNNNVSKLTLSLPLTNNITSIITLLYY